MARLMKTRLLEIASRTMGHALGRARPSALNAATSAETSTVPPGLPAGEPLLANGRQSSGSGPFQTDTNAGTTLVEERSAGSADQTAQKSPQPIPDMIAPDAAKHASLAGRDLFYVFALPKSGSRFLCDKIVLSQPPGSDFTMRSAPAPLGLTGHLVNLEVNPRFLASQKAGLFHSHAAALPMNATLLQRMALRYIITIRHPADHLAALFCHLRKNLPPSMRPGAEKPWADDAEHALRKLDQAKTHPAHWHSVISPVCQEAFVEEIPVEVAISHLINDGYFFSALKWLADWLWYRNHGRCLVVRYEDLLNETGTVVGECSQFFFGGSEVNARSDEALTANMKPPAEFDSFYYPMGYSGGVEVWRNYFSERNVAEFNEFWNSFRKLYRPAETIEMYYDVEIG